MKRSDVISEPGNQNLSVYRDRISEMKSLAATYAQDLPINARKPSRHAARDHKAVILTGSSGALGSNILHLLMHDPRVHQIWCFNRPNRIHSSERQRQIMRANGLTADFPQTVSFLETDLSQPYFGLSRATYTGLLKNCTHIIHNAWEVHFLRPLSYYESQIYGVRRLIDFCSASTMGTSLFFASSVGSLLSWNQRDKGDCPEEIVHDWNVAGLSGYAEAKFVSEQMLAEAAVVSNINIGICRIGQAGGPTRPQGRWNVKEWFPSILTSSAHLGAIPKTLGSLDMVDWLPVDTLAQIVLELYLDDTEPNDDNEDAGVCNIYHTSNPNRTTYSELLPSIMEYMPNNVKIVEVDEWLSLLDQSQRSDLNPALKLVNFYNTTLKLEGGGPTIALATTKTAQKSKTLREVEAVGPQWMKKWMRQWGFVKRDDNGPRL